MAEGDIVELTQKHSIQFSLAGLRFSHNQTIKIAWSLFFQLPSGKHHKLIAKMGWVVGLCAFFLSISFPATHAALAPHNCVSKDKRRWLDAYLQTQARQPPFSMLSRAFPCRHARSDANPTVACGPYTVTDGQRNPAARGVGRQSQRRAKRGGLRGEAVQNLEEARGGPRGSGVLCGGREHDGAGGNKEGASSSSSNVRAPCDPSFGGSIASAP